MKRIISKLFLGLIGTLIANFSFSQNGLSVLAGMSFANQSIHAGEYTSSFNYPLSTNNSKAFTAGYLAGFRYDWVKKSKNGYSLDVVINKMSTGTYYDNTISLAPFLGSYSHFKADNEFLNLNIATHYRKLLHYGDTAKHKFYFVFGPSVLVRLSEQSADNLVNNNYYRVALNADLGFEFNNRGYYTLFAHYKQGLTSMTAAPIRSSLSSIELGMFVKLSDLL